MKILRSTIFHTPASPFHSSGALVELPDGGIAIENGRIALCAGYAQVREAYPAAQTRDLREGCILPGFVDTHIHFPQTRIVGALGYSLLDWLEKVTLPEEARLADRAYAQEIASDFVRRLAAHGTTTALVFGAHFPDAVATLFEAAATSGLRIISGLVLSDRLLPRELLQSPEGAFSESVRLIEKVRGKSRLGYAVIPRFALSTSPEMLDVCRRLLGAFPHLLFTTHINENPREVEETLRWFPSARDYLGVYEEFGLLSKRSVLAHNVHTTDSQLDRIAAAGASVAHCPCSNAALGSGIFPMRRHLARGVHFSMGTDIGAGIGFGMMKEGLQAYLMQRVGPDPLTLTPAQMLYLSTLAGAEALNMSGTIGDFTPGKSADLVYLRRPFAGGKPSLSELFTAADASWVREVQIGGIPVYDSGM